jgi:hypothetical protein
MYPAKDENLLKKTNATIKETIDCINSARKERDDGRVNTLSVCGLSMNSHQNNSSLHYFLFPRRIACYQKKLWDR